MATKSRKTGQADKKGDASGDDSGLGGTDEQMSPDTRLSIAESAAAIEELKTFPEKVRALKKFGRVPRRTEVERLLRDMERQFETANLYNDEVIDELVRTGEEIKGLLNEKPQPGQPPINTRPRPRPSVGHVTATEISPEVEALRETLAADYETATKNLDWYGITETAEDGNRYYKADYDGSSEKDPNDPEPDESKKRSCPEATDFSGEKFDLPTLETIMHSLTPAQAALYEEYQEKGLEPHLQLTPLALKLRTLAGKLDAKKAEINAKAGKNLVQNPTYIWDKTESGEIDETSLLYEPLIVEASPDGRQLITKNGLTKSQLIKKYGGWLVEIVPMKPELEADADKTHKEITEDGETKKIGYTNAEKTALYTQEAHNNGESGLGYEDELMAQMNALAGDHPIPLEEKTWAILPESSLTKNQNIVAFGSWRDDQVNLDRSGSRNQNNLLRFRRSVRVYVQP